jgi:hypothetical protein
MIIELWLVFITESLVEHDKVELNDGRKSPDHSCQTLITRRKHVKPKQSPQIQRYETGLVTL